MNKQREKKRGQEAGADALLRLEAQSTGHGGLRVGVELRKDVSRGMAVPLAAASIKGLIDFAIERGLAEGMEEAEVYRRLLHATMEIIYGGLAEDGEPAPPGDGLLNKGGDLPAS